MELETKLSLKEIQGSANVAELLSEQDLATIGDRVWQDWSVDKEDRAGWEDKTRMAFDLALQVTEEKSFPWSGASNVKFPLVTIAALQYQARAYPSLLPSPDVVKCRVVGDDPDGVKEARAQRVSSHMSFQILEEDESWEEQMDQALIAQAIVGCAFKKTFFSPSLGHNTSQHVLAKDLYIPYYAKSLDTASRITQVLYFSENDLYERFKRGVFLDWNRDAAPQDSETEVLEQAKQEAHGVTAPAHDSSQPYEILEQHNWMDLDGDGYQEPYIVSIRKDTQTVLRIVARFKPSGVEKKGVDVIKITADQYFTKYPFIPSPDGSIYDLGFGVLLGPLNESINTLINQLIDAGTLSNTAGGFLGRGVKFRSGDNQFKPFEWKRVDSTGDDLRKGVFPLPVREPSQVLFQMLGLLIDYGERIGMAVDPLVGVNPGQNTPAETSRNMIAEGQRIFNSIFKRTYRSLKEEFRKWYNLNALYLDDEVEFYSISAGNARKVLISDYASSPRDIVPAADPDMISDEQKNAQALALKQAAMATPGYNLYEVEKKYLTALKITDIEKVYPDPKGENAIPQTPDAKILIATMQNETAKLEIMLKNKMAQLKLLADIEVDRAKVSELEAKAVKLMAEAEGVEKGQQLAAIQAAIGAAKLRQDGLIHAIDVLRSLQESNIENGDIKKLASNLPGMGELEAGTDDKGMV